MVVFKCQQVTRHKVYIFLHNMCIPKLLLYEIYIHIYDINTNLFSIYTMSCSCMKHEYQLKLKVPSHFNYLYRVCRYVF